MISSPSPLDVEAQATSQEINYDRTFGDGFPHRIRLQTITLHVVLITKEQQPGSFKVAYSVNGNLLVRFSGFMVNVRMSNTYPRLAPPDMIPHL